MSDSFAGRESPHFALPLLADFASALAQNLLLALNGVASFAEGIAGRRIGAFSHRVDLLRCGQSIKQAAKLGRCSWERCPRLFGHAPWAAEVSAHGYRAEQRT